MQLLRPFASSQETSTHFFEFAVMPTPMEEDFPTVYSTLSPQALTHWVFAHYDIEVPKGCRFWHRGLSDVYLVETLDTSYILRISHHHWRTKTDIDFELEFLAFLHHQKLPVAAPLKSKRGHYSLEIKAPEGKRYAALFPVAPGTVAIGDLNQTQAWRLGETVAQLHQASHRFKPLIQRSPLTLGYLLDQSLLSLSPFMDHQGEEWKYLQESCTQVKSQLQELPRSQPYWTVCWGDPHSGNVHFTADHQLTLFDFDQCGYGWRAFDVAKFLQVSLQTGLSRLVRDAFLKGYTHIQPLTSLELDRLQSLTQMAYIWAWAIHLESVKLYDYSRLDARYFTHRLQRLKQLRSPDWQLF